MGLTNSKALKEFVNDKVYDYDKDLFVDVNKEFNNAVKRNRELQNNVVLQSQKRWISLLTKENYNTLATIQKPMRNPHMMDANLERFFNLSRVNKLFYSVEKNRRGKRAGYHIHLMFDAFNCNKEHLAFALDVKYGDVQYYEPINSKSAVSGYVTKNIKADESHYNFYSK